MVHEQLVQINHNKLNYLGNGTGSSRGSNSSSQSGDDDESGGAGSVLDLLSRARGDIGPALRTTAQSARTAGVTHRKRKTGKYHNLQILTNAVDFRVPTHKLTYSYVTSATILRI